MSKPKYPRYQDYVIKDGKLIGEFEQMYRDYNDPWEQTTREAWVSEKAIALNFIKKLRAKRVIELGCGLGHFTNKIASLGVEVLGIDISETAIHKANVRYPQCNFKVGDILDFRLIRQFNPDVIVMAEITWYVLDKLDSFLNFIRKEFPQIYLVHLLVTYPKGVQQLGKDKFTNLDEIMNYFNAACQEWGEISYPEMNGCKRTYFVGRLKAENILLILQARMGSMRLPGKSMLPLAGKPLLGRILERVRRCKKVDQIIMATTQLPADDVLVDLARSLAVEVFRGSENDLVDRYYQAALNYNGTTIVRLPADNPVVEPAEIDRIIDTHFRSGNDFSANTHNMMGNNYPDGLGAEVYSFDLLKLLWHETKEERHREHPHTFVYEHPERFRIGTVPCPKEFARPDLVLDVNTMREYEFLSDIYNALYPKNSKFHITDIIEWYDKNKRRKDG